MRTHGIGRVVVVTLVLMVDTEASRQPSGVLAELTRDRPIERELAKGERHVYRVSLKTGQFLRVLVEPPEALVEVTLTSPDGRLASLYHSELRPESLAGLADVPGEFRIGVVLTPGAGAPGRYRLRIAEVRPSEPLDDHRARAERAVAEGVQSYQKGTPESGKAAIGRFEEALQQWQAAAEHRQKARTLMLLARMRKELGDSRAALDVGRPALAIFQEVGDRRGEAEALNDIGSFFHYLEDSQNAAHHLEQAITIYRHIGFLPGLAEALNNLGVVRGNLFDPQKAIDSYMEALQLYRQLRNRQKEAGVLNGLGSAYVDLGRTQDAADFLLASLAARREAEDRTNEPYTLHSLGVFNNNLGRFSEALEWLNQALPLWRLTGNRNGEAATLTLIAKAQHAGGHSRRALESANTALALFRTLKHQLGQGAVHLLKVRLSEDAKDRMAAQQHASAALDLCRSIGAGRCQAFALAALGRTATAAGEWDRATEHFRAALEIHHALLDVDGEVVATLGLARLERARGRFETAHSHAKATLALIESQRRLVFSSELRASLLAARHEAYEFATDLSMQLHAAEPAGGHAAEALETSERAKARSLLDQLVDAGADIRQGVDPELVAAERTLQLRLSALDAKKQQLDNRGNRVRVADANRQIGQLTVELRELRGRIRTRSPRYAALTEPQPVSVATLQRDVLDDDTVLLEYALGEKRSFLWAVTKRTITSYVLPAKADIEAAAREGHRLLTVSHQRQRRREAERAVDELARMLLGPAKDVLDAKRIVIVADGALQFVPFGVLPLDGGPLIRRGEVVHLPSASTLAVLRQELLSRPRAPKSVAVFADPVLSAGDPRVKLPAGRKAASSSPANVAGSQSPLAGQPRPVSDMVRSSRESGVSRFNRLDFTRGEAEAIRTLADPTDALVAVDFEANRARVIQGDLAEYRIVHFATHGLVNSVHPDLSGLVLSLVDLHGRPQDGFLRSHDIYNLRLGADLVVLSACRTALGEEIRGEGLVSLVRGFMYAGAPRVVASLWDVRDDATSELMRRFYAGMLRDGLAPAAALRAAQVWMSQHPQWRPPYYWAGFVLQGEWR